MQCSSFAAREHSSWDDLSFWQSGEWQACQERLDKVEYLRQLHCPSRENLFSALDACPLEQTKVIIMGQDPYPDPAYATGVAFSIPDNAPRFPPTLRNILKEYEDDLHHACPTHGNLRRWCQQGVLLWNAAPLYVEDEGVPISPFEEWFLLTKEIVQAADERDAVVCLLGNRARSYHEFVTEGERCIQLSHPSPRASRASRHPFHGSRLFSRINSILVRLGHSPVNWRL